MPHFTILLILYINSFNRSWIKKKCLFLRDTKPLIFPLNRLSELKENQHNFIIVRLSIKSVCVCVCACVRVCVNLSFLWVPNLHMTFK